MLRTEFRRPALFVLAASLLAAAASAQAQSGSITGVVRDAHGAPREDARITAATTGSTRRATTGAAGRWGGRSRSRAPASPMAAPVPYQKTIAATM